MLTESCHPSTTGRGSGIEDSRSRSYRRSADFETALWEHAESAAREAPNDITATFVTALNDMIDIDAERMAASRNRIPAGVWLLLIVVAAFGCFISAYASGAYGVRSPFTSVALPVLIAVVMLLIFDLMHERHGVIGVSQEPLIELQRSLTSGP
jgi:hypothetical protein